MNCHAREGIGPTLEMAVRCRHEGSILTKNRASTQPRAIHCAEKTHSWMQFGVNSEVKNASPGIPYRPGVLLLVANKHGAEGVGVATPASAQANRSGASG